MNSGFFHLPYPPTTNTLFAHTGKKRYKTKRYADWILESGLILNTHRIQPFIGPVWIDMQVHRPDERRRDLDNLQKGIFDLLVAHQVISDDSMITGFSAKWVGEGEVVWIKIRNATAREIKDSGLSCR